MSVLLLYCGIVLVAVPLMLMIGFATFIFFSFMKDDDMTMGIVTVGFIIMALGGVMIVGYFASNALAHDQIPSVKGKATNAQVQTR